MTIPASITFRFHYAAIERVASHYRIPPGKSYSFQVSMSFRQFKPRLAKMPRNFMCRAIVAISLTLFGTFFAIGAPFVAPRDPQCVAFSPDGKLVATGTSGQSDGQFPPRPHPDPRKCGVVQIWDVLSGEQLRRMETYGDLTKVAFSPDGTMLAASRLFTPGEGLPLNEVQVWDVARGRSVHQFDGCHGFAFSPDGKFLAVLSRSRCVLYDPTTREKLRDITPLGGALSVTYSPDGRLLAGIVASPEGCTIRLCGAAGGQLIHESAPLRQPFYTVAFSPDGKSLASGHAGDVILWTAEPLRATARFEAGTTGIQHPFFSPDGHLLAAGSQDSGDVVFWETATGKQYRHYTFQRGSFRPYHPRMPEVLVRPEKDPGRFAFSPAGDAFLAGCYGGIIRLLSTGRDIQRFAD